jgi:hypothetical protein
MFVKARQKALRNMPNRGMLQAVVGRASSKRVGDMTERALIICVLIIAALGLSACGDAGNPLAQMKLFGQSDDICQQGGAGNGMAAPQAAYAQCMQDRYSGGYMGFSGGSGSGSRFAPGSNPVSLNQVGQ